MMKNLIIVFFLWAFMVKTSYENEIPKRNVLKEHDKNNDGLLNLYYNDALVKTENSPRKKRGLLDVQVLDTNVLSLGKGLHIPTAKPNEKTSETKERKRRGLLGVQVLDLDVLNLGGTQQATTLKPNVPTTRLSARPMAISSCGRKIVKHTELITNGLATKPGDWPWHAALYRVKTAGSQQQYTCGGTLLSTTRVLTAAHCVMENTQVLIPERLFIVLGKYNLAGGDIESQERGVFDIVVHPEYSRQTVSNDIAILKLSSRVRYSDYVQPICLWRKSNTNKENIVNKKGIVIGWGFNSDDSLSAQLMKTEMPVTGDVDCIKTNPSFYSQFISDQTYCAGYRNGSSACNGDSGGGMFFSEKGADGEDIWSIRGIVSLSVSRKDRNICDPNEYVVFTDAAKYLDFIAESL